MSNAFFRRVLVLLAPILSLLFLNSPALAQYTSNGIYAEFNTSMGSYTCRLEYAVAPKAVANFIGLATGQRAWLDLPSGVVRTNPFYNGTTFHRVIAGFMNQGGSRNGQGTDDPGYQFVDEFSPSLRHTNFGVLSLANSGPDSNGSQYFITVSPQTHLNDVHTIFGRLFGGSNVVYRINHVATDANDKPLTNVVLQSIIIQRIGAQAAAFDIHAQGLPVVTPLNLKIAGGGANVNLTFSNRLSVENYAYYSTNLAQWAGSGIGIEVAAPVSNVVQVVVDVPRQFFRMAQVQYPALFVPKSVRGRTLTMDFINNGIVTATFDNAGGGTYTSTFMPSGTILGYNWIQHPYRGRFLPIGFSALSGRPMDLHLDYDSAVSGTFKGTYYPNYPFPGESPVGGTFTSTP